MIDSKDKDEDGDEDEEEVLMVEEDIGDGATTENIFDKIYDIFGINWVLFFLETSSVYVNFTCLR